MYIVNLSGKSQDVKEVFYDIVGYITSTANCYSATLYRVDQVHFLSVYRPSACRVVYFDILPAKGPLRNHRSDAYWQVVTTLVSPPSRAHIKRFKSLIMQVRTTKLS